MSELSSHSLQLKGNQPTNQQQHQQQHFKSNRNFQNETSKEQFQRKLHFCALTGILQIHTHTE